MAKISHWRRRISQAKQSPATTFRRIIPRYLLNLIGIDFAAQTELSYVELGYFSSKILDKKVIAETQEIVFQNLGPAFRHTFVTKFQVTISNVIVNTESNLIFVVSNDGKKLYLLKESSCWPSHKVLMETRIPNPEKIPQVNYAKTGLPNSGFYHVISDDLPDLLLNKSNLPTLSNNKSNLLNQEILRKINTEVIQVRNWVRVDKLTFVTKGDDLGYLHPLGLKKLKEFALGYNQTEGNASSGRFYISRSHSRRTIPHEHEIEVYLASKGFTILYAEELTLFDQVGFLRRAELIVGIHGAGLIHGVWGPNCKIIELMPINRINRCFEWQTKLLDNSYRSIYFHDDENAYKEIISQLEIEFL